MLNPELPPEILDYIVELLHDDKTVLKRCCVVSKSWIPRTRKHLFANIRLFTKKHLESLYVGCARAVTAADAAPGGWLTGFAHIEHLRVEVVEIYPGESLVSLAPFHGFSPVIKSLHLGSVDLLPSRISNLVLSSPLLEDLTVTTGCRSSAGGKHGSDGPSTVDQPSNPPLLTGSLELFRKDEGMKPIAGRLLSMPGGIHFRKLTLNCHYEEDLLLTMALVRECSHTLEFLEITCNSCADSMPTPVDLSKATRLKDLTFRTTSSHARWITMALQTITSKHRDLRQIAISPIYYSFFVAFGPDANKREDDWEQALGEWLELDRLLSQLWGLYSIPPKILSEISMVPRDRVRGLVGRLLPETTGGGTNLVAAWEM